MAEQAYAYVTLIPVAKGFQRRVADELSGAAPAAATAGARTGRAFAGAVKAGIAVGAAAATTAVAGLGVAVTRGFGRLQAIEEAESLLRGTGSTAAEVEVIMTNALASVKGTAFGLGEAATVAANAVAAGVEPGKDLESVLKTVADTAAVSGASLGEIGSVFNRVSTANRAYTAELNMLADRGIPIYQYLAEEAGVSAEAVREMASNGEIDSAMFRAAIENNISGAALEMGETTAGSFANVQASIGRVGANLIKDIFPRFSEFFNSVIEGMGPVEEAADELGTEIGQFLNPKIDTLIEAASDLSIPFQTVTETMGNLSDHAGSVSEFFAPIVEAFQTMAPLLPTLTPLIGLIATAFATIATEALVVLVPLMTNFVTSILPLLIDAFTRLGPPLLNIATTMALFLLPIVELLANIALPILTTTIQLLTPVAEFLITTIDNMGVSFFILVGAVMGIIAAVRIYKTLMILTTAIKAGLTAATYGFAGASYVSAGAQRAAYIAGGILNGTLIKQSVQFVIAKVALIGHKVALIASTVATKAMTVAQRALNLAMRMNPLGLIITLIAALIAGLIWFFTETEIGREIWQGLMDLMSSTIQSVSEWFSYVFNEWLPQVWDDFTSGIEDGWNNFVGFFEDSMDGIGDFFKTIINGWITQFENFVNFVIRGVNKLISGLNQISLDIPATAFTDAFTIGVNLPLIPEARIPRLAKGGFVDSPTMALIGEAGPEVVVPLDRFEQMVGMNGNGQAINYYAAPNKSLDAEQELIMAMRRVKVMA